jgi:NADH-quinone oxidoreductase subunit M
VALAGLGMPLLNSFVGEFLTLLGAFQVSPAWAVVASLGMVLACWYMLRLYQGITQGRLRVPEGEEEGHAAAIGQGRGGLDVRALELVVLAPLVALMVLIGVYPGPVIRYTRFSADQYVAASDASPAAAALDLYRLPPAGAVPMAPTGGVGR